MTSEYRLLDTLFGQKSFQWINEIADGWAGRTLKRGWHRRRRRTGRRTASGHHDVNKHAVTLGSTATTTQGQTCVRLRHGVWTALPAAAWHSESLRQYSTQRRSPRSLQELSANASALWRCSARVMEGPFKGEMWADAASTVQRWRAYCVEVKILKYHAYPTDI